MSLTRERFQELQRYFNTPSDAIRDLLAEVARLHPEWKPEPKWRVTCVMWSGEVLETRYFDSLDASLEHVKSSPSFAHNIDPPGVRGNDNPPW